MFDEEMVKEARSVLTKGKRNTNSHYVGSGSHFDAYNFEFDNQQFIVKYLYSNYISDKTNIEAYVNILRKAKGIKNVVQLVGYSDADKIIITDFANGKTIGKSDISLLQKDAIFDCFITLIATLNEINDVGLCADLDENNLILSGNSIRLIDPSLNLEDTKIENELSRIPAILSKNYNTLLKLIPIYINALKKSPSLYFRVLSIGKHSAYRFNRYEQLIGQFHSIKGLSEEESVLNRLFQVKFRDLLHLRNFGKLCSLSSSTLVSSL